MRSAIIIPCYNEAATLAEVVRGSAAFGDVFVVDDGSSDGSDRIAEENGAVVIPTGGRMGYEQVIERGLRHAHAQGYDFVITIDADGEHDPRICEAFQQEAKDGTPLVLGYRPAPQRAAEWLVNLYCRRRFGIRDVLCGMKGFSREVLDAYFSADHENLVNTWPALLWCAQGGRFSQVLVTGRRREGQARFNSRLRANLRIASMLGPIRRLRTERQKDTANPRGTT